jgi:hypothetical protein
MDMRQGGRPGRREHVGVGGEEASAERSGGATRTLVPGRGDLLRGWAGASVGYVAGTYGSGLVLNALLHANRVDLALQLTWVPWILGAILCGVGAGLAVRRVQRRAWWTWVVIAAPIPVGAFFLLLSSMPTSIDIGYLALARDGIVQVLVAATAATGVGLLRAGRPTPPRSE